MPAAFSRLQLAAALIEYDNDADNPDVPSRSAQESAIFAHLRRNPAARPELRKSAVVASQSGRISVADTKRSRASRGSLDALRNPFGADETSEYGDGDDEDEEEPAELEVDLSSWGLDAFIPKEKPDKSKKGKEKQGSVPVRSRTISGGPQEFGEMSSAVPHSRSASAMAARRQSISSRLDFADDALGDDSHRRRPGISQPSPSLQGLSGTVPFPSPRPQSPGYGVIDTTQDHMQLRSQSRASFTSRQVLEDPLNERQHTTSQGTIPLVSPAEDNPFALQAPTYTSRFDPKAAHTRTYSTASQGTQQLLGNDDEESIKSAGRDRPYSVVELLRPKVLVMPSPLQNAGMGDENQGQVIRDGFQSSRDGPPLPPGARTSRRLSTNLDAVPNPSNSFIPNPAADMSLAQRVFRDTLVAHNAGGYTVPDASLPRAQADGEQVEFEPPPPEDEDELFFGAGQSKPNKPAGKLYGKSLIDDLETRKAQMRNKQRVFTGDQRPTMMARHSTRSSTLIDPATLNDRPGANRQNSYGSQPEVGVGRRGSIGAKPFLSFDEESKHHQPQGGERVPKSKSVFGVDTLWEQEMAKLRIIQEQERLDEERRRKEEEEEVKRKLEKRRQKKLRKKGAPLRPEDLADGVLSEEDVPRNVHTPEAPPVLPDIQPTTVRGPAPAEESDSESSDSSEEPAPPASQRPVASAWHSDSEEEHKPIGPVRTTGVGLRNPTKAVQLRQSDSDEDVPLAATKERGTSRYTRPLANALDSDDEDKPLARVIEEKARPPILDIDFDEQRRADSDDEDSQPLGIRASTLMLQRPSNDHDDDKPLGFHPEQQRRTQYNLFAAQQQQNQLMMQAQFQNSMFFNPPMMTPPFFGPTMPAMMNPMAMMQPSIPIPIPSPPPLQDESKFLSVDKWRRDVIVDRDQH